MKMRVIKITQYGPPEVLQVKERAIPTPAKGEVLIRVDASGVCRPDSAQRQGFNPPPPTEQYFGQRMQVPFYAGGVSIVQGDGGKVSRWSEYYDLTLSRRYIGASSFKEWIEV